MTDPTQSSNDNRTIHTDGGTYIEGNARVQGDLVVSVGLPLDGY